MDFHLRPRKRGNYKRKGAIIREKGAIIREKGAIIREKGAIIREKTGNSCCLVFLKQKSVLKKNNIY